MFSKSQQKFVKRSSIVLSIMILLFASTVQFKAEAASSNFAPGELEAGAIMQWGGTVLLAAAENATNIDPSIMEQVHHFGKQAWQDADATTKSEITSSIEGYNDLWGTNRKYSLQWSSDAQMYLVNKWNEYFGAGARINDANHTIEKVATINSIIVPSTVKTANRQGERINDLGTFMSGVIHYVYSVHTDKYGKIQFDTYPHRTIWPSTLTTQEFPNAFAAYRSAVKELDITPTYQTVMPIFVDNSTGQSIQYNPLAVPSNFPTRITISALKGIVNGQGIITALEKPNIGRVGNSLTGEIAISYPTYIGDTGTFTDADAVTRVPSEAPVDNGGNGNGDGSSNDTLSYSPLDLFVYKAMLQFIQEYRDNQSNSLDQLLEYMKLNDSGKPANTQAWNGWLKSFSQ
ncbi:hypothetical protein ASD24_03245 [Paenibacillus sp. Root52]|uniref:hypothetical protein n=1 Tax=Paenibacillus sp. Root52 TaxID=1736552 RepID=UPI0006F5699E|nr:hypothetical protein [Paenibacillus sp. Root52]KQY94581.1 hypothetical protein ASD24_03245 [Paenibacillus sp. Root52]